MPTMKRPAANENGTLEEVGDEDQVSQVSQVVPSPSPVPEEDAAEKVGSQPTKQTRAMQKQFLKQKRKLLQAGLKPRASQKPSPKQP